MNEVEIKNLKLITTKYKHICITIDVFCDLLKLGPPICSSFMPETKREIIMTGLYGQLYSSKLWVGKYDPPNCIRVSSQSPLGQAQRLVTNLTIATLAPFSFPKRRSKLLG
jgi:hypothetical protein